MAHLHDSAHAAIPTGRESPLDRWCRRPLDLECVDDPVRPADQQDVFGVRDVDGNGGTVGRAGRERLLVLPERRCLLPCLRDHGVEVAKVVAPVHGVIDDACLSLGEARNHLGPAEDTHGHRGRAWSQAGGRVVRAVVPVGTVARAEGQRQVGSRAERVRVKGRKGQGQEQEGSGSRAGRVKGLGRNTWSNAPSPQPVL